MIVQVLPGCLQVRGSVVHCYLLEEGDSLTLIDGGFLTVTPDRLEYQLRRIGYSAGQIKNIVLTHGHIDHTLHIAELQRRSGAAVWAPATDEDHIAGRYRYRGLSRICGILERVARILCRYEVPVVDHWFSAGECIPVWGGLTVIPLPGHTYGHCGFYSPNRRLLFAGDLFANFLYYAKLPPRWFNVNTALILDSLIRADRMDLSGGVLLSHCNPGSPRQHRDDLRKLARRAACRLWERMGFEQSTESSSERREFPGRDPE
jgi:glyoxylase-like metal-dependent hydrolase (beta-lactamase superfamily II)